MAILYAEGKRAFGSRRRVAGPFSARRKRRKGKATDPLRDRGADPSPVGEERQFRRSSASSSESANGLSFVDMVETSTGRS